MPRNYKTLADQITAFLVHHGPSHVSKVTMGVRHNAAAAQVNETIDSTPQMVRFDYRYIGKGDRPRTYSRQCVRLDTQKESDYRDEYDTDPQPQPKAAEQSKAAETEYDWL